LTHDPLRYTIPQRGPEKDTQHNTC
jgi:hypothetical protein